MTYARNGAQQHNIIVVRSTLKIPPRHNGIIPITKKGCNLKVPVGYFISNQYSSRALNPNIHVIDVIYNIKGRLTLHMFVANYTNKHVTFNKGQCIGHIEPSIDHMPQTSINSLTTQKMIDEHVQPDTFTPPLHILPGNVRKHHSFKCWRNLNSNLCRMKQVLAQHISQKYKLKQVTQNRSCRGYTTSL